MFYCDALKNVHAFQKNVLTKRMSVTLTEFCNTVTGNALVGMELRNSRKSSWITVSVKSVITAKTTEKRIKMALVWIHMYNTNSICNIYRRSLCKNRTE